VDAQINTVLSDGADSARCDASDARFAPQAQTLYDLLKAQALRTPEAEAILAPGRKALTFRDLLAQIESVHMALNARGLGRGDRVALLCGRGPEAATAALGIATCATCAPLNEAMTISEIEQGLARVKASAVVVINPASGALHDAARRLNIPLLECRPSALLPAGRLSIHGGHHVAPRSAGPAQPEDVAFVLSTSGTTARAKLVPMLHSEIVSRFHRFSCLFEPLDGDRCLNLMPLCYHHGLNTGLMLPLSSGSSVILPPAFSTDVFFTCLRELKPTWFTGSFTYHQAILAALEQQPDRAAGHTLTFARSGSGPLPGRVREGLERILGIRVIEAYGSTETGIVTGNPRRGRHKPGTVGKSPFDDVAIMDGDGALLPPGKLGEVVMRGPCVFAGYEQDPEANRRIFRDGWYRTGDLGSMDADGYLSLHGRLDELINRGGEKIAPREVDEVLLDHPAVADAASFPVPHPTLHQELVAAVVLREGASATEAELRRHVAERLVRFKVPRRVLIAPALPKGPTGKVNRRQLADHFKLGAGLGGTDARANVGGLEQVLLNLWRKALKDDRLGVDDDFFICGGDSLMAVDLLLKIENELKCELSLTTLMESPTVAELAQRIARGTTEPRSDTIHVNEKGSGRPLFAVAGRGGYAFRLIPALRSLGADQPCFALQPPGEDWASVGCTTIEAMAAHYLGEIRRIQPCGPYRLLGTSFGGIVVYEMARQLQSAGEAVEFLGIVDTTPPNCRFDDFRYVSRAPEDEGEPRPAPINAVTNRNERVIASHLRAREQYWVDGRSGERLFRGELTYFYCTGELVISGDDPRRLWQRLAPSGYRLVPLAGRHGSYDHDPQFAAFKDALRAVVSGAALDCRDPAAVFERTFRFERRRASQAIVDADGSEFVVEKRPAQGVVYISHCDGGILDISGWAVDAEPLQPAQTIVLFCGDRCVGYGACSLPRPAVARKFNSPMLHFAGYRFRVPVERVDAETLRLFVLSPCGSAAELRRGQVRPKAGQPAPPAEPRPGRHVA
jgi:acyl-CoA synthetase (AMP-forming)/AMP-acid ligase II/acyl carrier protein